MKPVHAETVEKAVEEEVEEVEEVMAVDVAIKDKGC
jgi:hypothetical protein